MNTDNQTDTISSTNCLGYEAVYLGNWGIFKNGQLVCIRPNKEDALKWIKKQADLPTERSPMTTDEAISGLIDAIKVAAPSIDALYFHIVARGDLAALDQLREMRNVVTEILEDIDQQGSLTEEISQ